MPKRSNPFQQVVTLLHQQFATGGMVTESKFLHDSRTGKRREVDIVIEALVADVPVVMSVECIDHNRPATVEWVERMSAKHADLPTDKLVLVSRAGFTREATRKAHALNIITFALSKAQTTDWTSLVGKLPKLDIETLDSTYKGFIVVQSSNGQEALAAPRDLRLHNESGTTQVLFGSVVDYIVALPEVGATFLDHMTSTKKMQNDFTIEHKFPEPMFCIGSKGQNLIVSSLRVVFSAEKGFASVPLTHGEMRGAGLAYGEINGESGQLRVSIVEKQGQSPAIEVKKQDGQAWKSLVNTDSKTPGIVTKSIE